MTNLETKVFYWMEELDYLPATDHNDLEMIIKNILSVYGDNPTVDEIKQEIDIFYNS